MFASSITENQIIAGIITIAFFVITWFLPNFSEIFMPLSLINMFNKFPSGLMAVTEIVSYVTCTILFVILTILVLQKRKSEKRKAISALIIGIAFVLLFMAINLVIEKLDLQDIDLTKNKLFTLSDTSKQQLQKIDTEVTIYLVGFGEDSSLRDLSVQYTRANEHIKVEIIEDMNQRADLKQKYNITEESQMIFIETKENTKQLSLEDLYTYDYTTFQQIDITEEKITNAIVDVTRQDKPHLYVLTGHNEYNLSQEQNKLEQAIINEGNEISTLDLLVTGKVPEDTDLLIIQSPQKDYLTQEIEMITNYISAGGKILWLNDPLLTGEKFPNLQAILDQFGVTFADGIIIEQDENKIALQSPNYIIPNIATTTATKDIARDGGILLANASRIILVDDEELERLQVIPTIILTSSNQALFRTEIQNTTYAKISSDEEGSFIIGASLEKKISSGEEENAKTATLYVISSNFFVTDYPINIQDMQVPLIDFYNNKDYLLNTIAELTEREEGIHLRKDTGVISYTATQSQHNIIRSIIVVYPLVMISLGIIIWHMRNKRLC